MTQATLHVAAQLSDGAVGRPIWELAADLHISLLNPDAQGRCGALLDKPHLPVAAVRTGQVDAAVETPLAGGRHLRLARRGGSPFGRRHLWSGPRGAEAGQGDDEGGEPCRARHGAMVTRRVSVF